MQMEAHLGKMEFFCKLGYGKQDICKVLENLGQGALEDDVLKELIRVGSRPAVQERQAQHPLPKLVPRGSYSSLAVPKQPEEEASDSSSHLRPIVIDGSNIAMRYVPFHFDTYKGSPFLSNFAFESSLKLCSPLCVKHTRCLVSDISYLCSWGCSLFHGPALPQYHELIFKIMITSDHHFETNS